MSAGVKLPPALFTSRLTRSHVAAMHRRMAELFKQCTTGPQPDRIVVDPAIPTGRVASYVAYDFKTRQISYRHVAANVFWHRQEKQMPIPKKFRGTRYIRAYHCIGEVTRTGTPTPAIGELWRLERPRLVPGADPRKPWRARCCGHGLHASVRPSDAFFQYGWAAKRRGPGAKRYLTLVRCRYVGDVRGDKFAAKERTILGRMSFTKADELAREAHRLRKLPTATKTAEQYFDSLVRAYFRKVPTKGRL